MFRSLKEDPIYLVLINLSFALEAIQVILLHYGILANTNQATEISSEICQEAFSISKFAYIFTNYFLLSPDNDTVVLIMNLVTLSILLFILAIHIISFTPLKCQLFANKNKNGKIRLLISFLGLFSSQNLYIPIYCKINQVISLLPGNDFQAKI